MKKLLLLFWFIPYILIAQEFQFQDMKIYGTINIDGETWIVLYTDGSGDMQTLALGADDHFLVSTGAAGAPEFRALAAGDIPDISGTYETQLDNETGLYNALSDVTQFIEAGDNATLLDGTNWRIFYTDGSGDVTELALGSDGEYLKSNGAAVAPSWDTPAGGGATAYDDITDPDANSTIAFTGFTNTWTSTLDGGTVFKIDNTDGELSSATYLLELELEDDSEANGVFLICNDNNGDRVFQIGDDGQMTIGPGAGDYTMPTADGSANQFLGTDGAGAVTFQTLTADDIPSTLVATTFSGDVTINAGNSFNLGDGGDVDSIVVDGSKISFYQGATQLTFDFPDANSGNLRDYGKMLTDTITEYLGSGVGLDGDTALIVEGLSGYGHIVLEEDSIELRKIRTWIPAGDSVNYLLVMNDSLWVTTADTVHVTDTIHAGPYQTITTDFKVDSVDELMYIWIEMGETVPGRKPVKFRSDVFAYIKRD